MVEEASEDLDCFASFENDLKEIVKNQYFDAINYGKVAVVNYGKYLLRAQVVEGFKTQTDGDPFNLSRFKHDILEMWNTRELIGIRHNPFSKEERQNNPEVTRGGKYTFQFGSLPTLLIENKTTQLLVQQPFQQLQQSNQAFLNLEGELNLKVEEFPQLERIFYTKEVKIIKLLTYTSPTEILDKKYPKDKGAIAKLDLSKHGLRGKLDLKDFTGLEELKIELSSPGLDRYFSSNFITGLDLSANTKLKKLTLTNSPAELDLDIFTNLTALEELNIPKKYVH
ncbi:14266_t:CDS:2 [Funneliformis geosporum]|nr:14266_t:CDS:2 [Funneliformis geosporum]